MRREEKFTDQKSFNISSLQTDYLNIDSSSDSSGNSKISYSVQTKCIFCGGNNHSAEKLFKRIRKERRKLARLMFHPIDIWNVRLGNALDVDLKIT